MPDAAVLRLPEPEQEQSLHLCCQAMLARFKAEIVKKEEKEENNDESEAKVRSSPPKRLATEIEKKLRSMTGDLTLVKVPRDDCCPSCRNQPCVLFVIVERHASRRWNCTLWTRTWIAFILWDQFFRCVADRSVWLPQSSLIVPRRRSLRQTLP